MINILRMDSETVDYDNIECLTFDVIIGPEAFREKTSMFPFAVFLPNDDRTWSDDEAEIAYNKAIFSLGVDND